MPQTGPIYVEGAEPGDTLAVRLRNLAVARARLGRSAFVVILLSKASSVCMVTRSPGFTVAMGSLYGLKR